MIGFYIYELKSRGCSPIYGSKLFLLLLFSFSIFSDCGSLKIENEAEGKFDHRNLIDMFGTIGTQERVLVRQSKRAIKVRAIEVLQYSEKLGHLKLLS